MNLQFSQSVLAASASDEGKGWFSECVEQTLFSRDISRYICSIHVYHEHDVTCHVSASCKFRETYD